MIVVIDLSESRVLLQDPADFARFSVAVEGDGDLARWCASRDSGA
ncbi:MAG TPA: hypothetical protein VNU75_06575 [Acidimicrobiales bacterium]|nr:hypothetical protein [Acidimicrobiales bacterium]